MSLRSTVLRSIAFQKERQSNLRIYEQNKGEKLPPLLTKRILPIIFTTFPYDFFTEALRNSCE